MADGPLDAVVVGAGFSGLYAATRLVEAGKKTLILEARPRVGGKVYDKPCKLDPEGLHPLEAGAAFIGPGQDTLKALCDKLGVELFNTFYEGLGVLCMDGQRHVWDPLNPETMLGGPVSLEALQQIVMTQQMMEGMSQELDPAAPWTHDRANEWDSTTVTSWINGQVTDPGAKEVLTIYIRGIYSAEPEDISLLQALTYLARGTDGDQKGTWDRVTGVKGGAQECRFNGGAHAIAIKLAERLGDAVKLSSPVTRIVKKDSLYTIHSQDGENPPTSVQARSVIMALSPPLQTRIIYDPPLPAARDQLCQRMAMGSIGKVFAIYKKPFWRDDGMNGEAAGVNGTTVQLTFDGSPPGLEFAAMMGFILADRMRELDGKTDDEIKDLVLEDFVTFFGPKAKEIEDFFIQRWDNEEYSRGGHFAYCPTNTLSKYGPTLSQPVGNIFFAGTELSPRWAGYIEGALVAGDMAASAVIERLDG